MLKSKKVKKASKISKDELKNIKGGMFGRVLNQTVCGCGGCSQAGQSAGLGDLVNAG
jgi:natural product precursor